jgi:hypothetical protein
MLACALLAASMMTFIWRWPAVWRSGAGPVAGTSESDSPRRPAEDDLAPAPAPVGWLLLIGVMASLFAGWIVLVVLT